MTKYLVLIEADDDMTLSDVEEEFGWLEESNIYLKEITKQEEGHQKSTISTGDNILDKLPSLTLDIRYAGTSKTTNAYVYRNNDIVGLDSLTKEEIQELKQTIEDLEEMLE